MTSPEDEVADSASAAADMQSEGGSAAPPDPRLETERLAAELREANDRVLRVQAELENYRKRMRRELDEERKYASLPLLRSLLPVVDNLQRAIAAAEQNPASGGLLEGVKMVVAQISGLLEQHDCKKIPALGAPFDPHLHEALAQESSAQVPAGAVSREMQPGYVLHERVVRPAQVFVSTGAPK
jgi:molecular chaperone GrpE